MRVCQVITFLFGVSQVTLGDEFATPDVEFFENRIRPLLVLNCHACHSSRDRMKSGLALDSRAGLIKGGTRGPAVDFANPKASLLLKALSYKDPELAMPPVARLGNRAYEDFEEWIERGLPWATERPQPALKKRNWDWRALRTSHWAWQTVNRPAVPPLPNSTDVSLARSAIDHFVLSRLRAADLQPAPQAAPRDLIRRAYLDLVGIPPTPAAVQAFLVDPSPDAFARIVDQLLASPRYGERWGRHWLDVARYSDGFGAFQDRAARPGAYFYRDWVIRALNADMPYDEFVRMQIAGDLLAPDEHAAALGFFAVGPTYQSDGANPFGEAEARAETLEDRVDTLCRGFLGLTAGCARCHDHKFDPIPTLDYYSIAGVFNNTKNVDLPAVSPAVVNRYESGQVAIRETDARYNEWVAASKSAFSERLLAEAPRYVRDALHVLVRRSRREIVETTTVARDKGLVPEVLARWMAYLDNPTHRGKIAALDKWYAQRENFSETLSDEVADEVANAFSAHAKPLLGDPKALRPNRLKSELGGQAEDGFIAAAEKLRKELVPLFRFKKLPEEWLLVTEKQQVEDLRAEKKRARKAAPKRYPVFHALAESGDVNMRVALRGSLLQPGETAPRRFFQLLSRDVPPSFTEGSGRRGLAEAVANAKNPLTARVFVNRVWLHHFGKALVRTPSNFGSLGEPPTHPRLLDWLASEFVSDSWSIKALHRRILLSATYAMSSAHVNSNYEQDPDNRLLWRMNPRRLDVEIWRDTLLAVAGTLETTIGGPPQQELVGNRRRTVYAAVSRIGDRFRPDEFLRLFDFPSARATNAKRIQSVVPQQYLFMMNSEFMLEVAKALAARLEQAHPNEVERIEYAHALLYGRAPHAEEIELGRAFVAQEGEGSALTRWEQYTQVLLSANELLYVR